MTVLVTGYEPFGDHETNPSAGVAEALDGRTVRDHDVVGTVLPVDFADAGPELRALLDDRDPAVAVATGLAAGESAVRVERVGLNVDDCAGVPDNDGAEPRDEPIDNDADAPDAYFSTLACERAVEACNADGVPARLSNTAGTHLCNHALYTLRRHVERVGRDARVGFVHLPCTPAQAARKAADGEAAHGGAVQPSLPLGVQVSGVETTIRETLAASP